MRAEQSFCILTNFEISKDLAQQSRFNFSGRVYTGRFKQMVQVLIVPCMALQLLAAGPFIFCPGYCLINEFGIVIFSLWKRELITRFPSDCFC